MINWKLKRRAVRFFFQRLIRGWDDSDTWNLDDTIARFVLPRLKRFSEVRGGYPANITDEEWREIIDKILWSIGFVADGKHYCCSDEEESKRLDEGLQLFGEWFLNLWW